MSRIVLANGERDEQPQHVVLRGSTMVSKLGKLLIFGVMSITAQSAFALDAHAPDVMRRLGERLFSERTLSADGNISCADCHDPLHAFADGKTVAEGISAQRGTRNTPSLIGLVAEAPLFWDGRQSRLHQLVPEPLLNPREHGLRDIADLDARLGRLRYFGKLERELKGTAATSPSELAVAAIAAFVESLAPEPSTLERVQQYMRDGYPASTAQRGADLFRGRAGCSACHRMDTSAAPLTDAQFHDHGIAQPILKDRLAQIIARWESRSPSMSLQDGLGSAEFAALGRYLITGSPTDIGKFKTPSLYNVAATGPYMHDGSIATLSDAIAHEIYYSAPDRGAGLDFDDRRALEAFLRSLTDAKFTHLLK